MGRSDKASSGSLHSMVGKSRAELRRMRCRATHSTRPLTKSKTLWQRTRTRALSSPTSTANGSKHLTTSPSPPSPSEDDGQRRKKKKQQIITVCSKANQSNVPKYVVTVLTTTTCFPNTYTKTCPYKI